MSSACYMTCPHCGGSGEIEIETIVGYVTRDMAIDGCCPEREGEAVKGTEIVRCETCNGYGKVDCTREEYEANDD